MQMAVAYSIMLSLMRERILHGKGWNAFKNELEKMQLIYLSSLIYYLSIYFFIFSVVYSFIHLSIHLSPSVNLFVYLLFISLSDRLWTIPFHFALYSRQHLLFRFLTQIKSQFSTCLRFHEVWFLRVACLHSEQIPYRNRYGVSLYLYRDNIHHICSV